MFQKQQFSFRKNNEIDCRQVYLVDDAGMSLVEFSVAISKAETLSLDLVQVGEREGYPVCKIFDFSAFIYKQIKNLKQNKKGLSSNKVKTVRFSVFTDVGDFDRKVDQIIKFLEEFSRVSVFVKPVRGKNVRAQKIEAPMFQEKIINAIKLKTRINLDITPSKNPLYFYILVKK